MADHPFHGRWRSYVVRDSTLQVHPDGTFELNISPNGHFNSGRHNGNTLACNHISNDEITLEETSGFDRGTFEGALVANPLDPSTKVLAGRATFPDALAPEREKIEQALPPLPPGQNDGIWVATQP